MSLNSRINWGIIFKIQITQLYFTWSIIDILHFLWSCFLTNSFLNFLLFSVALNFQCKPFIINRTYWGFFFPDGGSTKSQSVGNNYHEYDSSMMKINVGWFVLMMILMVLFVFGLFVLSLMFISRHCTWTFPARSRRGYQDIETEERVVFSK